jgi:cytosine/adenosine deaminase-related metal-dependent hydrolase
MRRLLFVLLLFVCAVAARGDRYALRGTIVTPDEVIPNGVMVVTDGVITSAGKQTALAEDMPVIETAGFIYPGLIDLHNHLTWNAHPRWSPPRTQDRYEWQAMDDYAVKLSGPQSKVRSLASCDLERFAEVKVLVWGGTSTTGSLFDPCSRGLVRNLDYHSALYPADPSKEPPLQYRVFPMELKPADETSVRDALAAGTPVMAHLAEGIDASAARELRQARAHGYLTRGFVVIHGVPLLDKDFADLAANGVGQVWSPRSNIELYGRTADVAAAKRHNVLMAIAPDWSPSGSDGMIAELRYAALWNDQQFPKVFTPRELLQMATSNAAKLAGIDGKVGRLAPGMVADYVVVRRGRRTDPYEALFYAAPADMLIVAVGGRPLYGEGTMMKTVNPSAKVEAITVCGAAKSVDMSDSDDGKGVSFAETMRNLRAAFGAFQLPMAGLAECP